MVALTTLLIGFFRVAGASGKSSHRESVEHKAFKQAIIRLLEGTEQTYSSRIWTQHAQR